MILCGKSGSVSYKRNSYSHNRRLPNSFADDLHAFHALARAHLVEIGKIDASKFAQHHLPVDDGDRHRASHQHLAQVGGGIYLALNYYFHF
jgi:hypothetical protein